MNVIGNRIKDSLFLILGLTVVVGSIFLFFNKPPNTRNLPKTIKVNNVVIQIEIAGTQETRAKGLSDKNSLTEDSGMLFVFDKPARYGFWMKDMKFSIDIIWIDDKFRIIGMEKEVPPETFPEVFSPDKDVKYVLELLAGSSDRYNIKVGDVIQYK